jgi:hypothetical protein
MKKLIKGWSVFAFSSIFLTSSVFAQEVQRFTFNVGGGFTNPVGGTARRLNTGWNADIGAGINFNAYVGAVLQANFSGNSINSATLANIGFPDGSVRNYAFTLNPIVHVAPRSRFDPYIIFGGGVYHHTVEFTQPALAPFVGFDPFFGFFQGAVPVNQVLASNTVNKPGVNGGAGFNLGSFRRAKFYAEARYHRIFMGNDQHFDMVPVTFGVRF